MAELTEQLKGCCERWKHSFAVIQSLCTRELHCESPSQPSPQYMSIPTTSVPSLSPVHGKYAIKIQLHVY